MLHFEGSLGSRKLCHFKPSEIAGLSCMFLSAQDVGIPKGVLNVVTGDHETGAALVASPSVSMVSFTGSSLTGTKIMVLLPQNFLK